MPKQKPEFNVYEKTIINLLYGSHGWSYSTREVADKLGIAWQTADKNIKLLVEKRPEMLIKKVVGNRVYWKYNYDFEEK